MGLGALISLVATGISVSQANKASRQQSRLEDQKEAMGKADARDDRRRQTREARIRQAQVEQASVNTGVSGSSGEIGAKSGLSSSLGTNYGSIGSNLKAGAEMSNTAQSIADIQRNMQTVQAAGKLANSIFDTGSTYGIFETGNDAPQPKGASPARPTYGRMGG